MDAILNLLFESGFAVSQVLGPAVIALVTVPAFERIKKWSWISRLPTTGKQLSVLVLALLMTRIAAPVDAYLPEAAAMFGDPDTAALLAAAMAYAIHAGKRASEADKSAQVAAAVAATTINKPED